MSIRPWSAAIECPECNQPAALSELIENAGICRGCVEEHYRQAHEALYGWDECRECGQTLVFDDELRGNLCRRCDGVEECDGDQNDDTGTGVEMVDSPSTAKVTVKRRS